MSQATYPRRTDPKDNVNIVRTNFSSSIGQQYDPREWKGAELYTAPVFFYDEDFRNRYGKDVGVPEGRVGLEFADRVLEGAPEEDDELVVRMVESGEAPWSSETWMAQLGVERSPYPEKLPSESLYPILLDQVPDGFNPGEYDFAVIHQGGEHAIVDGYEGDGAVDLEDMR